MKRFLAALATCCLVACSNAPQPPVAKSSGPAPVPGNQAAPEEPNWIKRSGPPKAGNRPAAPRVKQARKPRAAAKPTAPVGPELIQNGGFEAWKDGRPEGWNVAHQVGTAWQKLTLEQATDATGGVSALKLPAATEGVIVCGQPLKVNKLNLGQPYTFSAKVKCTSPKALQVLLRFKMGEQNMVKRLIPKGTGQWETLISSVNLHRFASVDSVRVSIIRPKGSAGEVLLDDVSLLLGNESQAKPAEPAAVPAAVPAPPVAPELAPAATPVPPAPAPELTAPAPPAVPTTPQQ
ncbi:MAG: hypothetical protein HYV26_22205 [Candidatus Hydrogenedentes bacterium]|nr:hypothetical protein [Candidatus Hydrogenedentota bacterium]MBI3118111.1 hypothetical protein [Candidatus Hydrogenedentota bacterium]